MSRVTNLVRGAAALAMLAGAWGCSTDAKVFGPKPVSDIFNSYVALGNSITAGWQSGGINDSTQQRAYPVLLAKAMGTRFAYPSLRMPGCPPPQANFLTGALVNMPGTTTPVPVTNPPFCLYRNPASITDVLNNVAVPGAAAIDPVTQRPTANSSTLSNLILGGKSQVRRALEAHPTFATIWIGNNDVLGPATRGVAVATPALGMPAITTQADFQKYYDAMIDTLTKEAPGVKGVLIGVVQVTQAPVLWPAAALFNPAFRAGIAAAIGVNPDSLVLPTCGTATAPSQSLISTGIIPFLKSLPVELRKISCEKTGTPIGDYFVLDAQEKATFTNVVNGYNTYIHAKANAIGFQYWDPNDVLTQQKATGCISTVPNLASATAPYGACMSLDGAHPGNPAHLLIANALKDAINAKYGTSIPTIQ